VTVDLFVYAQQFYGVKHGDLFSFKMFASPEPTFDLIFQDSTQQLVVVDEEERNYAAFLGEEFLQAMHTVNCKAGGEKVLPAATIVAFSLLFARLLGNF
jgi:hypothetical protein